MWREKLQSGAWHPAGAEMDARRGKEFGRRVPPHPISCHAPDQVGPLAEVEQLPLGRQHHLARLRRAPGEGCLTPGDGNSCPAYTCPISHPAAVSPRARVARGSVTAHADQGATPSQPGPTCSGQRPAATRKSEDLPEPLGPCSQPGSRGWARVRRQRGGEAGRQSKAPPLPAAGVARVAARAAAELAASAARASSPQPAPPSPPPVPSSAP